MNNFGSRPYRIDSKGRVALPAGFRDGIEDEKCVYLAPDISQKCLLVFSPEEFEGFVERMQTAKREGTFSQHQVTGFMASVAQANIDSQGRVTLPEHLRTFAKLEKDVTLICWGGYIQIFPQSAYDTTVMPENVADVSGIL